MSLRVLLVVYDNGSYDNVFPMGVGAIGAILKRDGHEITIWNQDMHHWPDDRLRTDLDKNKFFHSIFFPNKLLIEGCVTTMLRLGSNRLEINSPIVDKIFRLISIS